MLDRHWHFEKGEYWDCSDVKIWRRRLKSPWPTDPTAELFEVLRGGQVPLIGIPVQPNILWAEERRVEFLRKERVGIGPEQDGHPMPIRIPPEYLAEVDLHVSASGGAVELWWNCGLLAWRFVHVARDELIQAYMAYFELPPVAAVVSENSSLPPQSSVSPPDVPTSGTLLGGVVAFDKTLAELLEWRRSLADGKWSRDYLEELRRLCARGLIEVLGRPVLDGGLGFQIGEQQPVPAEAFVEFELVKDLLTNHGELRGRLAYLHWTGLRFSNDAGCVWRAALEAGEPRGASAPLPEAAQPIPAAPAVAPAQAFLGARRPETHQPARREKMAPGEATSQPAETSRGSELVRRARAWLEETYAQPEGAALRDRVNAAIPGPGKYKKLTRKFEEASGGLKIGERDMRRALTGK